jgi:diguanylate cyclase (GGDEF)-like protein
MNSRLLAAALWSVCLAACVARGAAPEAFDATISVASLPAPLSGSWEIAFGDPADGVAGLDRLRFVPVRVPSAWQSDGTGRPELQRHGVAWYRLRVELAPALASTPLAFSAEQIRDADEVYFDGVRAGRTGRFPPAYDKGTLAGRVYPLPVILTTRSGPHVLAVRVYNAGPRGGGLTSTPFFDSTFHALRVQTLRDAPRALLAAAVGALGLFSLFFYLRDRRQTDFLWFFVFTASFTVYISTWLFIWTETRIPLSLLFRVNLAASFTLFLVFLLFFHRFFDRPLLPRHRMAVGVSIAGALYCLVWPRVDDLYYSLPVCYAVVIAGGLDILHSLVKDARREVPHARPMLAGCGIVFLAVLHDIAQDVGLFGGIAGTFRLVGPGFLVFSILFLSVVADRVERLRVAATTDPLTGLANRAVLFSRLALEHETARRDGTPLSLAVLDLDHFKAFNDEHGHVAGDRLLIATAQAIFDSVRESDLAARYGGEEFVVVLPNAGSTEALVCLERIRAAIAKANVAGASRGATASIGFAVFDPLAEQQISPTALLRQADAALYRAKEEGRDRVVLAEGVAPYSSTSGIFPALTNLARRRNDPKGLTPAAKGPGR